VSRGAASYGPDDRVELAHGAGGRVMHGLVRTLFQRHFTDAELARGEDAAIVAAPGERLACATDGYVVEPRVFPGGDIGALAVHGTVNDLACRGARPLWLTAGFILEEGLALAELDRLVASMAAAARAVGVRMVAGDTKVVERGKGDGVFVTTTGIGAVPAGVDLGVHRIRPGDAVVVSGTLGDHGVAVMSERTGLAFTTVVRSDSAALHELAAVMRAAVPELRALRDPTRGGVAATLNEIADAAGLAIRVDEAALPFKQAVRGACELLGLDPLNVANEGKLLAFCPPERAAALVAATRAHPLGRDAAMIGEVAAAPAGLVELATAFGGRRVVDWLAGEPLPRIC
jgi:hydrogenase expression/formation protein HypE